MNDRKRLAQQQKAVKAESDAIDTVLRDLLSRRDGRLLVWWLLTISNHGQQPFSANALTTAFNCGVFNVGQQLLARILSIDPQGYVKMLQDRAEEVEQPGGYDYVDPREDEG